jgi:hypothetical protein
MMKSCTGAIRVKSQTQCRRHYKSRGGIMKSSSVLILFVFLLMSSICIGDDDTVKTVGSIKTVEGDAFIIRNEARVSAAAGQKLFENDLLQTGQDGSMGVILKDDTVMSLGPESEIVIDEFVFSPEDGELSIVTKMLKGTVSYISGKISKLSPESARFETPVATIGIRGTHFLVKVIDEEESQQHAGDAPE